MANGARSSFSSNNSRDAITWDDLRIHFHGTSFLRAQTSDTSHFPISDGRNDNGNEILKTNLKFDLECLRGAIIRWQRTDAVVCTAENKNRQSKDEKECMGYL